MSISKFHEIVDDVVPGELGGNLCSEFPAELLQIPLVGLDGVPAQTALEPKEADRLRHRLSPRWRKWIPLPFLLTAVTAF